MAYCVLQDIIDRLSEAGAARYLDVDGDGHLNAAERQFATNSITYGDSLIDGQLEACGKKVLTAGPVIKRCSVGLAIADMCQYRKGLDPVWAEREAQKAYQTLKRICEGGLRLKTEVGPATSGNPGPVVANPRVVPGKGITWPNSKKTTP